jgi:protein-S-isoprenylcysteine O-methyltransferase Ste14
MVQALRIRAEERLLMQDTRYVAYAAQVRYRLIPGWW